MQWYMISQSAWVPQLYCSVVLLSICLNHFVKARISSQDIGVAPLSTCGGNLFTLRLGHKPG